MRKMILALALATAPAVMAPAQTPSPALIAAVAAPTRTAANTARDPARHPAQTLAFFGVKPTDRVVEIWPFGGWYTEILAPYVAARGHLTAAAAPGKYGTQTTAKLDGDPATYGKVGRAVFPSMFGGPNVPPNSVDVVLTFRNIHNWRMGWNAPDKADYAEAAFREMFAMLKPGGVLGIEDHRLPEGMDSARERTSGYIKVSTVKALAEKAGFRFAGASEVNANPRDTHDYPKGVWTLPPSFAQGDTDRARYAAIGESDRMTLKFVKPR
jgi:predicted methyltransferase